MSVSRKQALRELLEEARQSGVTIHSDEEAEALLDWAAMREGAPPKSYQAVTYGNDIFIRPEYVKNVRILREEMIHVAQQRAGIRTDEVRQAEVEARLQMIRNRHKWGLSKDEIREIIGEVRRVRSAEKY